MRTETSARAAIWAAYVRQHRAEMIGLCETFGLGRWSGMSEQQPDTPCRGYATLTFHATDDNGNRSTHQFIIKTDRP